MFTCIFGAVRVGFELFNPQNSQDRVRCRFLFRHWLNRLSILCAVSEHERSANIFQKIWPNHKIMKIIFEFQFAAPKDRLAPLFRINHASYKVRDLNVDKENHTCFFQKHVVLEDLASKL